MLKKELCFGGISRPDFSYDMQQKLSMDFIVRSGSYTASDGTKYVGAHTNVILDGENPVNTGGSFLDENGIVFDANNHTRPMNFYTVNGKLNFNFSLYDSRDQSLNTKTLAADVWITSPSLFSNRHFVCMPKIINGVGEIGNLYFVVITEVAKSPAFLERDILDKKIYISTFYVDKVDNVSYYRIASSYLWDGSPKINLTNDVPDFMFTNRKISGSYAGGIPDTYIYDNANPEINIKSGVDYPIHVDIAYGIV